ncbi:MAG TPA: hypothetical protein PLL10_04495 [Elusimicrobiales bacterium]|nr:hypothetical protein [Elusimicrobiales bacterium]
MGAIILSVVSFFFSGYCLAADNVAVSTAAAPVTKTTATPAAPKDAQAAAKPAAKAPQKNDALTPKLKCPDTSKQSAQMIKKTEEVLKKMHSGGRVDKEPPAMPSAKQVLQCCKDMDSGDYATRKKAFYRFYPLRIGFQRGWTKFPEDAKAKMAMIALLNRELDYQNPPPDLPKRPCRGDGCSRYLMDLLMAVSSIHSDLALQPLLKSYSGLAGFGGFIYLAVTQRGEAAMPSLLRFYKTGRDEVKERALFSLIVMLKGGGWDGSVRASTASVSAITEIVAQELRAKTEPENFNRKVIATRLLRNYHQNPALSKLAASVYEQEPEIRKACDQSYIGGFMDKQLLRYLRVESTLTEKPAAKEQEKK